MSQKSTRRARRHASHDDDTPLKLLSLKRPANGTNGTDPAPPAQPAPAAEPPEATNGGAPEPAAGEGEERAEIVTRSRSQTPLKVANGAEAGEPPAASEEGEADEPDPELVFEEGSDMESGKSSPSLLRCKTRRSSSRNVSTPKTPKLEVEAEAEVAVVVVEEEPKPVDFLFTEPLNLNITTESTSEQNCSTQVEIGSSDSTRLDYIESTENSFLNESKNKSFGETLRTLSTRRTIRPILSDYRKLAMKQNFDRADYSAEYPLRNSIDRISTGGLKRRNDDGGELETSKRFKADNGFFARLSSPLNSIRSSFRFRRTAPVPENSLPKLTGYKDAQFDVEEGNGESTSKICEINEERRWCSIIHNKTKCNNESIES